ITASVFSLGSAPDSMATTLFDSKCRTLLTMWAFNFAPRFTGRKSFDRASAINLSKSLPDAATNLFPTSNWTHDATFNAGPSSFRDDFSPEFEFRTTSHGELAMSVLWI